MNKHNLKVGQTVWLKKKAFRATEDHPLREAVITKIGKKYFYTDQSWDGGFLIDHLKTTDTNYPTKAYLTKEDYENEVEKAKLGDKVRSWCSSHFNINSLTLEQLQSIHQIITQ